MMGCIKMSRVDNEKKYHNERFSRGYVKPSRYYKALDYWNKIYLEYIEKFSNLELNLALVEIKRLLKINGCIMFAEPLDSNLIINVYRYLTPNIRTPEERPLSKRDLDILKSSFKSIKIKYFGFLTLFFSIFNINPPKIIHLIDNFLLNYTFIGKYIAWSCLIYTEHIPSTNITYIEPNPSLIEELRINSQSYSASILQCAISDICGNHILSFDTTHSGGGTISNNYKYGYSKKSVEVETFTLDYLSTSTNLLSKVNNVKVDVEGFELNVFKGGSDFFKNNRPNIVFELSNNDFTAISKILSDYSFFQLIIPGLDYEKNIFKRFFHLFNFLLIGKIFISYYDPNASYCSGIIAIPNEKLPLFNAKLTSISLMTINFY
jgi:FkbM family methyltransferase